MRRSWFGVVFVLLISCVHGFLPRWLRRSRVQAGARPISEREKQLSWALVPPDESQSEISSDPELYEGDIFKPTLSRFRDQLRKEKNSNRRFLKYFHTWRNGHIPYVLEDTFTEEGRLHIARAFAEIESKTCIRFVPRDGHPNYIYIQGGKDCASHVGRMGGGQPVSLAPKCQNFGIIMHELLHSMGFWHEQSRYDRGKYVDIQWTNIPVLLWSNFIVNPYYFLSDVGLPYDYRSILHYASNSFAKDQSKDTITPYQEGIKIGQRKELSELNIESINLLYDCGSKEVESNSNDLDTSATSYGVSGRDLGGGVCLDLWWPMCPPLVITGGCWWGDYLMRRYCRSSCGLC